MNNKFYKLTVLERITAEFIKKLKKAAPRFEKGVDPLIFAVSPVKPC